MTVSHRGRPLSWGLLWSTCSSFSSAQQVSGSHQSFYFCFNCLYKCSYPGMSAPSPSHFLSLPVSFCLSVFSMFQRPTIHSTTAKGHFPFESQHTHTALVFNSEDVPKGSDSSKDFLCSPCPCVSGAQSHGTFLACQDVPSTLLPDSGSLSSQYWYLGWRREQRLSSWDPVVYFTQRTLTVLSPFSSQGAPCFLGTAELQLTDLRRVGGHSHSGVAAIVALSLKRAVDLSLQLESETTFK